MKDRRDGENKVDENLMLLAGIALSAVITVLAATHHWQTTSCSKSKII